MSVDIEDPRRVLARHGFAPKKAFSQNFLVDKRAVQRIAEATRADASSVVVELGPGAGTLTTALLATGAEVVGVERDRDMAQVLRAELGDEPRFSLVEDDAATVDLTAIATAAKHPATPTQSRVKPRKLSSGPAIHAASGAAAAVLPFRAAFTTPLSAPRERTPK